MPLWLRANGHLLSTDCMHRAQPLGTQPPWDAGEEWMEEWNVGALKHFFDCDHLSSCRTQTLLWTWLGTVWAGEVWAWGEAVSMKLILCLSLPECQLCAEDSGGVRLAASTPAPPPPHLGSEPPSPPGLLEAPGSPGM